MSTLKVNAIQGVDGVERYMARAWVNFNGTGTVAIRAAGNVSSITDNGGAGDFTINFTNPLPDANYSVGGSCGNGAAAGTGFVSVRGADPTVSALRISCINANDVITDFSFVNVVVFR